MCDISAAMNDLRRGREMFREMRRSLRPVTTGTAPYLNPPASTVNCRPVCASRLRASNLRHRQEDFGLDADFRSKWSYDAQVQQLQSQSVRHVRRRRRRGSSAASEDLSLGSSVDAQGGELLAKVAQLEEVIRGKDKEVRRKSQEVKDSSEHLLTRIQALFDETKQLRDNHNQKARELEQTKSQVSALQAEIFQQAQREPVRMSAMRTDVLQQPHQEPVRLAALPEEVLQQPQTEPLQMSYKSNQEEIEAPSNHRGGKKRFHLAKELERIHARVMHSEDQLQGLQERHKEMQRKHDSVVEEVDRLKSEKSRSIRDAKARRQVLEDRVKVVTEALKVEYENLLQTKRQQTLPKAKSCTREALSEVGVLKEKVASCKARVDSAKLQLEQVVLLSTRQEAAERQELGEYSMSLSQSSATAADLQQSVTQTNSRMSALQRKLSDLKSQLSKREEYLQMVEFETDHAIAQVSSLDAELRSQKLNHVDSLVLQKKRYEASCNQTQSKAGFFKSKIRDHVSQISTLQDQVKETSNMIERLRVEESGLKQKCADLSAADLAGGDHTGPTGINAAVGGEDCVAQIVHHIETCQAQLRHENERIERAQQLRTSEEASLCAATQACTDLKLQLENQLNPPNDAGCSTLDLKQSLLRCQQNLELLKRELEQKEAEKSALRHAKRNVELALKAEGSKVEKIEREVVSHKASLERKLLREQRQLDANNHESAVAWAKLKQALNPPL